MVLPDRIELWLQSSKNLKDKYFFRRLPCFVYQLSDQSPRS